MAKEKLAPAVKPVPSAGGVRDGGKKILSTPKNDNNGRVWGTQSKNSIMK